MYLVYNKSVFSEVREHELNLFFLLFLNWNREQDILNQRKTIILYFLMDFTKLRTQQKKTIWFRLTQRVPVYKFEEASFPKCIMKSIAKAVFKLTTSIQLIRYGLTRKNKLNFNKQNFESHQRQKVFTLVSTESDKRR